MTRQQGSVMYAEAARRRGDDIRLMASIETIGWYNNVPGSQSCPPLFNLFYPNRANFIGFVSNFRSRAAMRRHFVPTRISQRHTGQAGLSRTRAGHNWFVCRLLEART
jgi:hypothetical protein